VKIRVYYENTVFYSYHLEIITDSVFRIFYGSLLDGFMLDQCKCTKNIGYVSG